MNCLKCNRPVQHRNAWREIKGFEIPRDQGGTNHVAMRKPTGRYLCLPCMHVLKSGGGEQGSLLGP